MIRAFVSPKTEDVLSFGKDFKKPKNGKREVSNGSLVMVKGSDFGMTYGWMNALSRSDFPGYIGSAGIRRILYPS
jgi:hypothetical protein